MSEIEVSKVKVAKNRHARPEAVIALAESIGEIGLLNPIILDEDNNLIAGLHRLLAHKHLALKDPDFKKIEFRRSDLDDLGLELARIDENLCRNQMTALERSEATEDRKEIWERLHPETKHGKTPGKKGGKGGKAKGSKDATVASFAKDTASKTGVSQRSVQQYAGAAKALDIEAKDAIREMPADKSPGITELEKLGQLGAEQQRAAVARAKKDDVPLGKAIKGLKRDQQVAQVKAYRPPAGEFGICVFDYPWKFGDERDGSEKSRNGADYPKMTLEEICAFPLPVAENCLLACWIPNALLIDGTWERIRLSLEQRYGAKPKQLRTWWKTEADGEVTTGLGKAFRNDTEQLILLERGTVTYVPTGKAHEVPILRTAFTAPVGRGSEKPAIAYEQLLAICPMRPCIDVFARDPRPGWVVSGAELPPKREGWVEQAAAKDSEPEEQIGKKLRWTTAFDGDLLANGKKVAYRVVQQGEVFYLYLAGQMLPGSFGTAAAAQRGAELNERNPAINAIVAADVSKPYVEAPALLNWKSANDGTEDQVAVGFGGMLYRIGATGGKTKVFHAKAERAFLPGSWAGAFDAAAACEAEDARRREYAKTGKKPRKPLKIEDVPGEVVA